MRDKSRERPGPSENQATTRTDSSFIAKFITNGTQNLVIEGHKRDKILPGRSVCQLKYPALRQFSVKPDIPRANVYAVYA